MTAKRAALEAGTEIRSVSAHVEKRADGKTIAGYAAVFNSKADIGGYFREQISPGAFADTIKNDDVRAYFDHDSGRVLGRKSAGTLRLKEDDKGLAVEIDLPDTTDGADVRALLERGDVDGMSFGFIVRKETWDETQDPPLRTIQAVELREVSVVSEPAYTDTSVGLRSLEAARAEHNRATNFDAAARRVSRRITLDLRGRE